ncbi:hypothetical protein GCM10011321_24700 [Youhaiella tibetensis]|uniref:L,D-transpeptidase n=1 Tax=Paradevosia tibetensis TaxID=1447062 RepID=A0A5B9DKQ3_9HYPH|nr:L,D-transpeptidase [Youhaiella tibetensis]QEE19505.1 L,D-transpeptidase [Youhaiella tibetensis]GGF32549.1 hypothetical protein GCM10011321_24700 [Youhaiella tibetensis]
MLRFTRAAVCALAVTAALTADAFAGQIQQYPWVYAPPPGITLVNGRPSNALQLQSRYRMNPVFLRQVVRISSNEHAGTIIVDTNQHFLYFVLGAGKALRYGIGTAKTGFEWSGTHRITNKREWPDWTPPAEMLKRRPDLPRHMAGGVKNPLGARALYIGSTLYRIHGTNEPWTIGGDVSSGCIRMTNDDVMDLFSRVQIGTKVIVL